MQQPAQLGDVLACCVLGRELGAERFDGALRVHDLGGAHAGEVELHGERLGEQPRIAVGDARAAALAHADFDDAERFQRAQRVARHDAARLEAGGELLLGAEKIAGLEPLGEQRVAHLGDYLRRQRRRAAGEHDAGGQVAGHRCKICRGRSVHGGTLARRGLIVKIVSLGERYT